MSLQVSDLQEAVVAVRAPMRSSAFVDEEVRVQVCLLLERLVAHLALEPLHARVAKQVGLQVVFLRELLAADLALPRLAAVCVVRYHSYDHRRGRRVILQLAVRIVAVTRYYRCASRVRARVGVGGELGGALHDAQCLQLRIAAPIGIHGSGVRRVADGRADGSTAAAAVATRDGSIQSTALRFHASVGTTVEILHRNCGRRSGRSRDAHRDAVLRRRLRRTQHVAFTFASRREHSLAVRRGQQTARIRCCCPFTTAAGSPGAWRSGRQRPARSSATSEATRGLLAPRA